MTSGGGVNNHHGEDLCLLAVDGGGVRGISSLLILKKLMESLNPDDPPKPCNYFDMIGGTSTGGLIAIMLGRLHMSVDECIAEYKKLSPDIFTKIHHRVKLRDGTIRGRFNDEALKKGIQNLLIKLGVDPEALFKEDDKESRCKTFVCATSRQTSETVVFSNYYSERRGNDMRNIAKIWQAARATSAASSFFEPIDIGGEGFVDGGTGANNPIQELWAESADCFSTGSEWNLENHVHCLVSIGTGKPCLTAFGTSLLKNEVGHALVAIATNTDKIADTFQKHHSNLYSERRAFRFNVLQGLENVGLEEASKISDIEAATRRYIQTEDTFVSLKACAANLKEREWLQQIRTMVQNRPHHNWSSSVVNEDETSLSHFPHTSSYISWTHNGGTLCYRKNPSHGNHGTDDTIAASILAYVAKHCQRIQELAPQILYFHCNTSRPPLKPSDRPTTSMSYTEYDTESLTDPEDLVRSLILQALYLVRYQDTRFRKKLRKSCREYDIMTENIPGLLQSGSLHGLLRLFRATIAAANAHFLISLDNVEGIKKSHASTLISALHALSKDPTVRRDTRLAFVSTVRLILSGTNFKFISQTGHYREVQEDTEYWECMQCMPFDRQDARRNEIVKAESRTTDWIWSHKAYLAWLMQTSGILWIQGKPGSGKSVLAKNILEQRSSKGQLDSPSSSDLSYGDGTARALVCDWFYSTRSGSTLMSHRLFLQSILHQLLSKSPSLFRHFKKAYRECPPLSKDWLTFDAMMGIMTSIAASGVRIICVVDAMDESEDQEAAEQQRRTVLNHFSVLVSEIPTSRMKVVVFSRPSPDIEQQFWRHRLTYGNLSTVILEHENGPTIRTIVDAGVESLRQALNPFNDNDESLARHRLPQSGSTYVRPRKMKKRNPLREESRRYEDEECNNIRFFLIENAQGVILWVTLVIASLKTYIESGVYTFPQLREKLTSLPTDLDALYRRISQDLLSRLDNVGRAKSRKALMWVSGANSLYPLKLIELREALAIPEDVDVALQAREDPISGNVVGGSYDLSVFRRQLRVMCGPLVEVIKAKPPNSQQLNTYHDDDDDEVERSDLVQLTHRTVKDFLADPCASDMLAFSDGDAALEVEKSIRSYIAIALPTNRTAYAGWWTGSTSIRTDAVPSIMKYLEHRTLMPFILSVVAENSFGHFNRTQLLHYIIDKPIPPIWKPLRPLREELRSYMKSNNQEDKFINRARSHVLRDMGEGVANLWLGRIVLSTEYIEYGCSHGLVTAVEILLRLLPLFIKDQVTDGFFFRKITQVSLMAAVRNNLHGSVRALSVMSRYDAWVRSRYPWKASECAFEGSIVALSPLELAAAKIGNAEMAMELFDERLSTEEARGTLSKLAEKSRIERIAQGYEDPGVEGADEAIRLVTDYIKQAFPGFWALKRLGDKLRHPNTSAWKHFKQAVQIHDTIVTCTSDIPIDVAEPPPRTIEDLRTLFRHSRMMLFWWLVTRKNFALCAFLIVLFLLWLLILRTESFILGLIFFSAIYTGALEFVRFYQTDSHKTGYNANDFLPSMVVGTFHQSKPVIDEWLD